ncbi:MAG: PAC2 family protein [Dehalococcoidia bacterium]|nr:PAC2 family protein [Dehalococcoidia bacterium]
MPERTAFRLFGKPDLKSAYLVVTWNEDGGRLGTRIADYLARSLDGEEFAQIDPPDFFPLGGVAIEDDVARFPTSKFYQCRRNLALFTSSPPRYDWYRFLDTVMDVARDYCHVRELYTVGAMVTMNPHTVPRQMVTVSNGPEMTQVLKDFGVASDMDFETPPGQRPTLNSFLIWVAERRNIPAATLWVPVPFYLANIDDPQAALVVLRFLDRRAELGLDFSELSEEVRRQNERLEQARRHSPDVDGALRRLENNIALTQEESEKLMKGLEDYL